MSDTDLLDILLSEPAMPIALPQQKREQVKRWYWRCGLCLSVYAVETGMQSLQCGACGGTCEYIGRVSRARLVFDGTEPPCDGRCTGARGPVCDCSCGGENHGSGATVAVTYDQGPVPVAVSLMPDKARAIAAEFDETVQATRLALGWYYAMKEAKRNGEWISSWSQFMRGQELASRFVAAKHMLVHKTRIKKLAQIAEAARNR